MRSAIVAAAPPLAAFGLVVAFFTAEAVGLRPLGNDPANLSEAAAVGAAAVALRFIDTGADPNTEYTIGPGVIGILPRTVNAIDAAILGRQEQMLLLLLEHGARVTHPDRTRCLAAAVNFPEILPALDLPPIQESSAHREDVDGLVDTCLHERNGV